MIRSDITDPIQREARTPFRIKLKQPVENLTGKCTEWLLIKIQYDQVQGKIKQQMGNIIQKNNKLISRMKITK